jgi:thioredoxin-related protein
MNKNGAIAIVLAALFAGTMVWAVQGNEKPTGTKESTESSLITWNKYDQGVKLAAKSKKPMLIDFYTDWCGFCKKMDKQTYIDPQIAKYINDHFVAIKLNAESKDQLDMPDGPSNGIQVARSFGVRSYPQTWFLESNGKKMGGQPGYMPPQTFIHFLKYYGDGHYKKMSFQEYYDQANSNKKD